MDFDKLSHSIIGAALRVHSTLGPGLFEEVYKVCLKHELIKGGFRTESELPVPILYDGISLQIGYRLDLLVENTAIVELKSVNSLAPVHRAQLLTYLKLTNKEVGLLFNFNTLHLKQGIIRIVN
jgi:GxxExxY protein